MLTGCVGPREQRYKAGEEVAEGLLSGDAEKTALTAPPTTSPPKWTLVSPRIPSSKNA